MSDEQSKRDVIARATVEKLADNLKSSAENVLELLSADEIKVETLLETTRFMARTARRIGRRANWQFGDPSPGNAKESAARPAKRESKRKDEDEDRPPRRTSSSSGAKRTSSPARRSSAPRR